MAKLKTTRRKTNTQAGKRDPYNSGYHVGSVSKSGHILWMYDEDFTLEEAEVVAGNSRLGMLAPGVTAPKTLPLPPRAARRLEKFRQEGPGVPMDQPIPIHIVTCGNKFVMASDRLDEIQAYVETYNKYRRPESPAAVVVTRSLHLQPVLKPFRVLDNNGKVIHETETKHGAAAFRVARGHGTVFKVQDDGTMKRVKLPPLPNVRPD